MKEITKTIKPRAAKKLLYGRVESIKRLLPKDWRKRLISKYPEYDSLEMADVLTRVHALRTTDEPVTRILEEIAAEYQAELMRFEKRREKQLQRQKVIHV